MTKPDYQTILQKVEELESMDFEEVFAQLEEEEELEQMSFGDGYIPDTFVATLRRVMNGFSGLNEETRAMLPRGIMTQPNAQE